jgi:hypothetical protein
MPGTGAVPGLRTAEPGLARIARRWHPAPRPACRRSRRPWPPGHRGPLGPGLRGCLLMQRRPRLRWPCALGQRERSGRTKSGSRSHRAAFSGPGRRRGRPADPPLARYMPGGHDCSKAERTDRILWNRRQAQADSLLQGCFGCELPAAGPGLRISAGRCRDPAAGGWTLPPAGWLGSGESTSLRAATVLARSTKA